MKKNLTFLALLFFGIIIFLPKANIYYSAEKALSVTHLYLRDEQINDRFVYLDVRDASLLLDTLPIGTIERITIVPMIFYNKITMSSLNFNKEVASIFPQGIESVTFTYSLWHPLSVIIEGKAGFGPINGTIDLSDKQLTIYFEATRMMRSYPLLLSKLHKSEKGLVYETSF